MAFRRNGVRPSPFDGRDLAFAPAAAGLEAEPSGRRVLLELPWGPWNQGTGQGVPCCVSITVITCMELLDLRNPPAERLSALYHYYVARRRAGVLSELTLRDGLHKAATEGACRLDLHQPRSADGVLRRDAALERPEPAAHADARLRTIVDFDPRRRRRRYYRLPDPRRIEDYRAAIHDGRGVTFLFHLTGGYRDLESNGDVHGDVGGRPLGDSRHAVVAVGYDDDRRALWVRDSRGTDFGDGGHWWMPYGLVRSPWLIEEAWTIEAITYD